MTPTIQVPTNGAKGFLDDYTLSDLPHKKTEETCKQCDENNKAVSYCKTCSDYFCDSCLQAHKRLRLFQDHETVSVEGVTDSELTVEARPPRCTDHPDEQLKLYCQDCNTLTCIHCFVASHNGHKVDAINDRGREIASYAIKQSGHHLYSNLKKFRANLEYIKTVEKDKMEQSTQLKDTINTKVNSMITRLEARRAELLKKVEDTYMKDLKGLWAGREHLETVITSMEGALLFAKRVLDCKNDTRILVLNSQVTSCLKELSQQQWDRRQIEKMEMNELFWSESKAIHVSKRGDRTRYISGIELVGTVSAHSQYDEYRVRLTIQNVPSEVKCGQEAEFQVTTAIVPQAYTEVVNIIQIDASIQFNNRYFLDPGHVNVEHNDSRSIWTVRFTPNQSGTCHIELRAKAHYKGYTTREPYSPSMNTPDIRVIQSRVQAFAY